MCRLQLRKLFDATNVPTCLTAVLVTTDAKTSLATMISASSVALNRTSKPSSSNNTKVPRKELPCNLLLRWIMRLKCAASRATLSIYILMEAPSSARIDRANSSLPIHYRVWYATAAGRLSHPRYTAVSTPATRCATSICVHTVPYALQATSSKSRQVILTSINSLSHVAAAIPL